jgi:putative DNA primase/helicase
MKKTNLQKNELISLKNDLDKLTKYGIIYQSIILQPKYDNVSKGLYSYDKFNHLKKEPLPTTMPKYANKTLKTIYNKEYNASIIPLGEPYNLIGIDIDCKDDTIEQFENICMDNDIILHTLTTKTMNNGYHYYFTLSKDQKNKLSGLTALTGALFNLHIDVKYNNQLFFGPTIMNADKIYKYELLIDSKPMILPDFLFNEIIKCYTTQSKQTVKNKKITKTKQIKEDKNEQKIFTVNENDIKLKLYLDCLKDFRFDDYDEWIRIGAVIFNENGSFELFNEYSQRSKKYTSQDDCITKWNSYSTNRDKVATMKTLMELAKYDDYTMFVNALLKDPNAIMNEILFYNIDDVLCAYLFYSLNPKSYVYDVTNQHWYKINKYGIYELDKDCLNIKNDINKILLHEIEKMYMNKCRQLDEEQKTKLTIKYLNIRKYLHYNGNKGKIINELCLLYKHDKFFENADNVNNKLIAFNNGVYDLETFEFRNAKPEELITCTTGYNYGDYDPIKRKELERILESIMPDMHERTYLLTTIALGLIGELIMECFYIWIGNGANGKGVLRDFISVTFGGYFDNMEIDYLCKNKQGVHAGAPDPVMARKKNSRIVITTEPDGDVNINCGKLKQLSGGDPIQVRFLFKESFNFTPKFYLIIQTNEHITLNGYDGGIIRRLKFIKFTNKFVDDPVKDNDRKIDRTLKPKIQKGDYRLEFFQILVEHYKKFKDTNTTKLTMPTRFKTDTEAYLNDNDPVAQFIEAKLTKTNYTGDNISSSDLYKAYCEYYDGDNKKINTIQFKTIMSNKGFETKRDKNGVKYTHVKLINNINDLDD